MVDRQHHSTLGTSKPHTGLDTAEGRLSYSADVSFATDVKHCTEARIGAETRPLPQEVRMGQSGTTTDVGAGKHVNGRAAGTDSDDAHVNDAADADFAGTLKDAAGDATKAIMKKLINAGAPWARYLAIQASLGSRAMPYNSTHRPAAPVARTLAMDRFWQDFDCVRLTVCNADTRSVYMNEKHLEIQLKAADFTWAGHDLGSSRTAFLLFDVDSRELLGIWKAKEYKPDSHVTWRVLKRLPPMGEGAFHASTAGYIFPELPPTETSAMVRGADARLVLRVLAEHAASISPAIGRGTAPLAQPAATPEAPPAAPAASHHVAAASGVQSVESSSTPPRQSATAPDYVDPPPPAVLNDHSTPSPGPAAPSASATASPPASVPSTVIFGAFSNAEVPVKAPLPNKAGLASGEGTDFAAAVASPAVVVQGTAAVSMLAASTSVDAPAADAVSASSSVAAPLVTPHVDSPTGLVPPCAVSPPPAGGAPPPPPVYLPPVLMLQRQRRAAEEAAPNPSATAVVATAAMAVGAPRPLVGPTAAVPQVASVTPQAPTFTAAATAPSPTVPVQVQMTLPHFLATHQPPPALSVAGMPAVAAPALVVAAPTPAPVPAPAGPAPPVAAPVLAVRPSAPVLQPQPAAAPARPSFLAAMRASVPPAAPTPVAIGASAPQPVMRHPNAPPQPVMRSGQHPAAAQPQPVVRPQQQTVLLRQLPNQPTPPAPAPVHIAQPRLAVPAIYAAALGVPQLQQPVSLVAPPVVMQEAPTEPAPARPVSGLSCPLCLERLGCWFLLDCKHMGPCEECCTTPEQLQSLYPACVRCGKAVAAKKVIKARVS